MGKPGKKYKTIMTASNNYGTTFDIKPKTVTGDIGENITAGFGKKIIWYVNKDYHQGIKGEGYAFAVNAELRNGGGKTPINIVAGVGLTAGVVYIILKILSDGSGSEK